MKNGCVEYYGGTKQWYKDGKLHRIDGPARELINGNKYWLQHGKLHRLDGPAVEYDCGLKYWFYRGVQMFCFSQEEFERILKLKAFW
jgi:hypothetical protein